IFLFRNRSLGLETQHGIKREGGEPIGAKRVVGGQEILSSSFRVNAHAQRQFRRIVGVQSRQAARARDARNPRLCGRAGGNQEKRDVRMAGINFPFFALGVDAWGEGDYSRSG
ncbi:MAG TPA: hypothetical protein VEU52_10145, partial [Candidatus Limnocylindrales bacterium]|nr:hypothetical protein [Candidatus Limnocylindrales bacterium]